MYVVSVGVGGGSLVQGFHVMAYPRIPEVREAASASSQTHPYLIIREGRGEKDPWCVCCVLIILSAQNTARPSPELPLNPSQRPKPTTAS